MLSYDKTYGIVGSFLEPVPIIGNLQSRFDSDVSLQWLHDNLHIPIASSFLYLLLVYSGVQWMKGRNAYNLKQPLFLWNVMLSIFSFLGTLSLLPNLIHGVYTQGMFYSVCVGNSTKDSQIGLWGFLFVISKIFEFFDTAFLVLRKRPVNFLHWYHHTTVLIYSWYILGGWSTATGLWFSAINFAVHTIMYSYYSLRSASIPVSSNVALFITVLQILQMFIGLAVNLYVFHQSLVLQRQCNTTTTMVYFGLVVYGSYAFLFLKFFLARYVWKSKEVKNE